jgi:hypothetical protein
MLSSGTTRFNALLSSTVTDHLGGRNPADPAVRAQAGPEAARA